MRYSYLKLSYMFFFREFKYYSVESQKLISWDTENYLRGWPLLIKFFHMHETCPLTICLTEKIIYQLCHILFVVICVLVKSTLLANFHMLVCLKHELVDGSVLQLDWMCKWFNFDIIKSTWNGWNHSKNDALNLGLLQSNH